MNRDPKRVIPTIPKKSRIRLAKYQELIMLNPNNLKNECIVPGKKKLSVKPNVSFAG
jgi:hypothetical protein